MANAWWLVQWETWDLLYGCSCMHSTPILLSRPKIRPYLDLILRELALDGHNGGLWRGTARAVCAAARALVGVLGRSRPELPGTSPLYPTRNASTTRELLDERSEGVQEGERGED